MPFGGPGRQILAHDGLGDDTRGQHPARGVHLELLEPLGATQPAFQHELDALFAHVVAQLQIRIVGQFFLVGPGHIAEQMGQGFPVSVVSFGPDDDAQSRPILEVGLHHRHQIKRNVGDDDLLVKMFDALAAYFESLLQILPGYPRPSADLVQSAGNIRAFLAYQRQCVCRSVFSQKHSIPVVNDAARRKKGALSGSVLLRPALVEFGLVNLQIPQPDSKDAEKPRDQNQQKKRPGKNGRPLGRIKCTHAGPTADMPRTHRPRKFRKKATAAESSSTGRACVRGFPETARPLTVQASATRKEAGKRRE